MRGTFVPGWKTVSDPKDLGKALWAYAERQGAVFLRGDVGLAMPSQQRIVVQLRHGRTILARQLVIAAGAWSHLLARQFGDRIPLETERGYNTTLPKARLRREAAADLFRARLRHHAAAKPGCASAAPSSLAASSVRRISRARRRCWRRRGASCRGSMPAGGREWMGYRPSLPDSLPVIGRARSTPERILRFRPRPSRPDPGCRDGAAGARPDRRRSRRRLISPPFRRNDSDRRSSSMPRHSFFCIDGHTCGNPVRLVAGGGPQLQGATMMERRAHFLAEYDWIRTGLMFEPRGHDVMSGSILYPPTRDDCDIAILFIETSGCLPMCGHGTIGTVTFAHRAGAGEAEDARRAQARHAGRPCRRRIQAGRRLCRGGAHHQRRRPSSMPKA